MPLEPDTLPASKRGCSGGNTRIHSPYRIATPPPPSERATLEVKHNIDHGVSRHAVAAPRDSDVGRGGLDVDAVDDQLRRAMSRTQRDATPGGSPSRKRQRINGDR